jgi:PadR family transcriptional regulator, regulatory protein AphA
MSTADLTTTSYALLGLLAIRPWTTYELAQQMERSLKHYWPRAQSRIYEEPKRLVALGLAKAKSETVGRRPRTLYSITARGRKALERWLAEPGGGPTIEFEALLKVFYAEHTSKDGVLANVAAIRAWAEGQNAENVAFARTYLDTGGPFPERLAPIVLTGKFMADFTDMVLAWSEWAAETVASWPASTAEARPPLEALAPIARRRVSDA